MKNEFKNYKDERGSLMGGFFDRDKKVKLKQAKEIMRLNKYVEELRATIKKQKSTIGRLKSDLEKADCTLF